jgi:glutaconate CoA-transferase subunit A
MTKLRSLEDAAALVPNGATIALGGLSLNGAPMAFVRELVRQGSKDLTVVSVVAGMPIDWLVAGGCVRRVVSGLVSLEGFGLAPNHRAAVQRGDVIMDEYSEHTLICRLQAATYRLPFVSTRAGLGTDMVGLHPDTTRVESDPVTGEQYVACTPLAIDIAIVHVNEADVEGNARLDPKLVWMDAELTKAAAMTIVTAERIVPNSTFRDNPGATTYPRFAVDVVSRAPWGAYPTSCSPEYGYDSAFIEAYAAAATDPDEWKVFWQERIVDPVGPGAFLDANGGARILTDLTRRTA